MGMVLETISVLLALTSSLPQLDSGSGQSLYRGLRPKIEFIRIGRVIDGDTVVADSGERIRIRGIDAAELTSDDATELSEAEEAKEALRSLTERRLVEVRRFGIDKYGRTIGEIWINNIDIGSTLKEIGYVREYGDHHNEAVVCASAERQVSKSKTTGGFQCVEGKLISNDYLEKHKLAAMDHSSSNEYLDWNSDLRFSGNAQLNEGSIDGYGLLDAGIDLPSSSRTVSVRGHLKKNGTYVMPYSRRPPTKHR